jgi:hypothetical protein
MRATRVLIAAAVLGVGFAGSAKAILFTVQTANQGGIPFQATPTAPGFNFGGAITATFDYTGPLTFVNTQPQNFSSSGDLNSNLFIAADITGYSGSGTLPAPANANFNTLANFLASSGSAGNFQYVTFYTVDLGILLLFAFSADLQRHFASLNVATAGGNAGSRTRFQPGVPGFWR